MNGGFIANDELRRVWKEAAIAHFRKPHQILAKNIKHESLNLDSPTLGRDPNTGKGT
jgi:hypothetical protein